MTEWRPSVVNPYSIEMIGPVPEGANPTAFTAFEAGIRATVKAQREKGEVWTLVLPDPHAACPRAVQGRRVFIPDDDQEVGL